MTHRTKTAAALYEANPEVFEFMAAFAKFEYALKKSGRARTGKHGQVEPDWKTFQADVHARVDAFLAHGSTDQRVKSAQAIMNSPPGVQALKPDNSLEWRAAGTWGDTVTDKLCSALKRVRNNLFHGGKELRGNVARDLELIRWSLDVLDLLLEQDDKARTVFEET